MNDSLRDEVALLRHELAALRSSVKATRVLLVLVVVLGVLGMGFGGRDLSAWAQNDGAMELTCKSLKVVDDKGKVRVLLTYDKFGGIVSVKNSADKTVATTEADGEGGFISIAGNDGVERTFVGVGDKMGGGFIYLKDDKNKRRATFNVYKDGHGGLVFNNAEGKNEIFLGPSTKGWGGLLNLNGPDGKSRLILDIDKDGRAAVEVLNSDQKSEVFLGASTKGQGGLFNLNAPNGGTAVILDVDDKGVGRVNLRNKEAKRYFFAGGDEEGGTVSLYGLDSKQRVFLGVGDKQTGGLVYLLNPDNNKARVVLGIDNNGVGYVEGRDDAAQTKRSLR